MITFKYNYGFIIKFIMKTKLFISLIFIIRIGYINMDNE